MKGASVKKIIFRFFSTFTDPPSHFLSIPPRFLTNISRRHFSLNIWIVYDQLELDWCIFDQNWAKTRPLHFQIFQILNATDRRIVSVKIKITCSLRSSWSAVAPSHVSPLDRTISPWCQAQTITITITITMIPCGQAETISPSPSNNHHHSLMHQACLTLSLHWICTHLKVTENYCKFADLYPEG